ncbi:MAG: PA14 domain-containing protein [Planctomycetota bacterium]
MRRRRILVVLAPLFLLLFLGGTAWVLFGPTDRDAAANARNARGGAGTGDGDRVALDGKAGTRGNGDGDDPDDNSVVGRDPGPIGADPHANGNPTPPPLDPNDPNNPAAGGVTVNPGAGAAASSTDRRPGRGNRGNRNRGPRRQGVPHELLSSKPVKLPEFNGSPAITTLDPNNPNGGLLGSYFEPQNNPANGKLELAPPDQWGTFQRLFSRLDRTIDFASTADLHLDLPGSGSQGPAFMARWDGTFNVVQPGRYAFFVGHTGDMRVFVDGAQVFSDNDSGIYLELFFTLDLVEGQHPVQITWYHKQKNAQTRLRYYTPPQMAVLDAAGAAPDSPTQHTAVEGDTPATLAATAYGTPTFADLIIDANLELGDPDQLIEPGTSVTIPPLPADRIPSEPTIVPPGFLMPAVDPAGSVPPILERVEPKSAGVGDEVVLIGRDFSPYIDQTRVEFGGQLTHVVSGDATSLRVIVPIGAQTGSLTVLQGDSRSNALTFKVTTVFGLLASFHDLTDQPLEFVPPGLRPADDVHVTQAVAYGSRSGIDSAIKNKALSVRYDGRLGVPESGLWSVVLAASEAARLTVDNTPLLELPISGGEQIAQHYFEAGMHPIVIQAVDGGGAAHLAITLQRVDGTAPDAAPFAVPVSWWFPPADMPAAPPEIVKLETSHEHGPAEGETFVLQVKGVPASDTIEAFIDGIVAPSTPAAPGNLPADTSAFVVTVPTGVGHGNVTVRYRYLTSLPAVLPLRDVGLLGRYYDFPEENMPNEWPAGFPDDRPVTVMRHDHELELEGTGDFDLPFVTETFGAVWTGFIRIDAPGTYHFWVGGDDGMAFRILGDVLTLDDGTVHYYKEIDGEVELAPGLYPIEVRFWENRRHEVIKLFWQPPGGSREIVPRRVLRMPNGWEADYAAWQAGGSNPPGGGSGGGESGD